MYKIKATPKFRICDDLVYKDLETDKKRLLIVHKIKRRGKRDFFYSYNGRDWIAERYLEKVELTTER
jgi:hypothetical protein